MKIRNKRINTAVKLTIWLDRIGRNGQRTPQERTRTAPHSSCSSSLLDHSGACMCVFFLQPQTTHVTCRQASSHSTIVVPAIAYVDFDVRHTLPWAYPNQVPKNYKNGEMLKVHAHAAIQVVVSKVQWHGTKSQCTRTVKKR